MEHESVLNRLQDGLNICIFLYKMIILHLLNWCSVQASLDDLVTLRIWPCGFPINVDLVKH